MAKSLCDRNVACDMGEYHEGACVLPWRGGPVPIPQEPWSEIASGLWQGGSRVRPYAEEFDAVLTLYHNAGTVDEGVHHKMWLIEDSALPDVRDLNAVVDWVTFHWLHRRRRVLVRCQAGLNRSGLVVASTLVEAGMEPMDAIQLIRKRRSPHALSNNDFYAHVKGLWSNNDFEYYMEGRS